MIQGAIFVLKLLGILLLAVLLLLLAAVLCALFVPVRYRIRGELPEGGAGAFGEGKISWLFGMLSDLLGWIAVISVWIVFSLAGLLICLAFFRKWKKFAQEGAGA